MVNVAVGIILVLAQLSGPGASLPQVMEPSYSTEAVAAGRGEVTVSFDVKKGYVINRVPSIQLKLDAIDGLTLRETNMASSPDDPKSTDEYYVDVPTFSLAVESAESGQYEIPGKLVYFFCSKADGFCSRQVLDVKIPLTVE
jgi:hypothetical protein